MKFDKATLAITLGVASVVVAGCDRKECVDAQGRTVAENLCKGAPTVNQTGGTGGSGGYSGPHFSYFPFWMFWGHGGGYGYGARPVSAPVGEAHGVGGVSRGGFGATAAGHAGAGE